MEKDTAWNVNQKKAEVSTLLSDKIDFKIKTVTRDKEEHCKNCMMTKGSIQEDDRTIANIYSLNAATPKYINWTETNIKGKKLTVRQYYWGD